MTEKEQYLAMLQRANIPYEIYEKNDSSSDVCVTRGYSFFFISHLFDKDGTLIDVGAYE